VLDRPRVVTRVLDGVVARVRRDARQNCGQEQLGNAVPGER
jgi:hypothetical protein